jgi:hypothetical protein
MLVKRVCGPRRVVLAWAFEETGAVTKDPALADDMNVRAYVESYFDPAHIKTKPGFEPSWITIRPLLRKQREVVFGEPDGRIVTLWYQRCGTIRFENVLVADDAGAVRELQIILEEDPQAGPIAPARVFEELDLPTPYSLALYHQIRHLTEAMGPLAMSSPTQRGPTGSSATEAASA